MGLRRSLSGPALAAEKLAPLDAEFLEFLASFDGDEGLGAARRRGAGGCEAVAAGQGSGCEARWEQDRGRGQTRGEAMKVVTVLCIYGLLLLAAPLAGAAEPQSAPAVSWSSLSAEQRQVLADFESRWAQLPPQRQRSLARGSQRWLSMPPEQRQQAGERFKRWKSLDADQRKVIRERYRQFKQLPDGEQARIRKNFRQFQSLTPEQRRELRQRFRDLPPRERQRLREKLRR